MRNNNAINVTKPYLPPMEEYVECIKTIWNNNWMTNNGPLHQELSRQLKIYLKVDNLGLFCNGHLALDIALKALELKGEVITTPFTFASTTHAIVMNGLKPVFCDINFEDYTIDADKIENLITEDTSAIVPVHVYGIPCDVEKIQKIADKYNLKVIYDAAHTFGVQVDGTGIGEFGDISMFSLHATKVYNTIEGGLLTYKNSKLANKLEMLKNFGISGPETVDRVGLNAKMNEFQAAMGLVNLKHVDDEINKRREVTNKYIELLNDIKGIKFLNYKENIKHNYIYFPIMIDESKFGATRDDIFEELKKYNINARKYFYPLVTDFNCYKEIHAPRDLTVAEYVSRRVLSLPIYGEMTNEEIYLVCNIIRCLYKINGKVS